MGLSIDAASFAQGELAASAIKGALQLVVNVAREAVVGFAEFVKSTAESGKELIETAEETGLTTQALQELRQAAVFTGVDVERLDVSIFHLARSMAAAKRGGEQQSAAFAKLGVKLSDQNGKVRDTDEVFGDLADAFSKMPDGLEKTGLAMEVFGRTGARMIPMLNKGREGLKDLRAEAFIMTPEQLENSRDVVITLGKIGIVAKSLLVGAIAPLLPEVKELLNAFLKWRKESALTTKGPLMSFFHQLINVAKVVVETFALLSRNADVLIYSLGALTTAMVVFNAAAIWAATATARAWMVAAAPFLVIAGIVAGFLLLVDDMRMYAKYGDKADTVTGDFVKLLDEFTKPKAGDPWWLKAIREFADTIREALHLLHELNGDDAMKPAVSNPNKVNANSPKWKRDRVQFGPQTGPESAREPDFSNMTDEQRMVALGVAGVVNAAHPSVSEAPRYSASAGGAPVNYVTRDNSTTYYQITQAPGQDQDEFVRKVKDVVEDHHKKKNADAAAAVD